MTEETTNYVNDNDNVCYICDGPLGYEQQTGKDCCSDGCYVSYLEMNGWPGLLKVAKQKTFDPMVCDIGFVLASGERCFSICNDKAYFTMASSRAFTFKELFKVSTDDKELISCVDSFEALATELTKHVDDNNIKPNTDFMKTTANGYLFRCVIMECEWGLLLTLRQHLPTPQLKDLVLPFEFSNDRHSEDKIEPFLNKKGAFSLSLNNDICKYINTQVYHHELILSHKRYFESQLETLRLKREISAARQLSQMYV